MEAGGEAHIQHAGDLLPSLTEPAWHVVPMYPNQSDALHVVRNLGMWCQVPLTIPVNPVCSRRTKGLGLTLPLVPFRDMRESEP